MRWLQVPDHGTVQPNSGRPVLHESPKKRRHVPCPGFSIAQPATYWCAQFACSLLNPLLEVIFGLLCMSMFKSFAFLLLVFVCGRAETQLQSSSKDLEPYEVNAAGPVVTRAKPAIHDNGFFMPTMTLHHRMFQSSIQSAYRRFFNGWLRWYHRNAGSGSDASGGNGSAASDSHSRCEWRSSG